MNILFIFSLGLKYLTQKSQTQVESCKAAVESCTAYLLDDSSTSDVLGWDVYIFKDKRVSFFILRYSSGTQRGRIQRKHVKVSLSIKPPFAKKTLSEIFET